MDRTFETIVIDKLGEIMMILNEHTEHFKKIDATLAEHSKKFEEIEATLDEHTEHFKRIDATLAEHSAILKEHSSILKEHSSILKEHSKNFDRNHDDLMLLFNYISDVDEHYHSRLKKLK